MRGNWRLQYPNDNRGQGASVLPLSRSDRRGYPSASCSCCWAELDCLLVIACVNVSSLLLVRSESRKREIAVRGALGASRGRLIRQFITEGLVLMAAGTLLGLVAADAGDADPHAPHLERHDGGHAVSGGSRPELACSDFCRVTVSLFAAALFSLPPVLRLPLTKLREGLTEGGRGYAGTLWRRFGANLVVVELAIAVVLLVGAGLLGKSFYRLLHVDVGFQPDHLATLGRACPMPPMPRMSRWSRLNGRSSAASPACRAWNPSGSLQCVARELQRQHDLDQVCGPAVQRRTQ